MIAFWHFIECPGKALIQVISMTADFHFLLGAQVHHNRLCKWNIVATMQMYVNTYCHTCTSLNYASNGQWIVSGRSHSQPERKMFGKHTIVLHWTSEVSEQIEINDSHARLRVLGLLVLGGRCLQI